VRFELQSPAGTVFNSPAECELSPDGRTLEFTASDSAGTARLYVRALASREARVLPGTEGATSRLFELGKAEFPVGFTPDEQRFLIGSVKDASTSTRLEVILGWSHLLEQAK